MLRWSLRKRCLTTLAGFLVTLIPLLFPPGPLLVSEATTRILGPVDESGKLRFRQYFNQAYDQVRPEDNGYELLVDPLPADLDTPWQRTHLHPRNLNKTPSQFVSAWCNRVLVGAPGFKFDQLPIPQLAPVNDLVRPYFEELLGKPWAEHKPGRFDHHLLAAQLSYAMEHPWTRKDFPVLAHYIRFNKQVAMDALLQSAECPVYIPRVKKRDNQGDTYSNYAATEDSLINQSQTDEYRYQNLGLALQLHTTLMIGEGKTSSWLNQLGRLHASIRQQTRTDKRNPVYRFRVPYKEMAMLAAYATILRHVGTNFQICQQLTEILDALPPALTETEYVDQVLRYYVLDFIQETKQFGTAPYWNFYGDWALDTPPLFLTCGSMMTAFTSWDKETIHIHQWMDSLADTVREPDAETRSDAVQTWVAKMIRADMGLATRACLMTYLKTYLMREGHQSELMLRDRMVLLRQQIAIERYRRRTGVYPNQLNQVEGIALNHGDEFPMSNNNLFFRSNETGYMLGLSQNDLWESAFSQSLYLRPSLFHPQGHKVYRTHLSELHAGWVVKPFHVGGEAYELLRLSDEEVIAERERLQLDEDDIWIEERRQSAAINELQQAGARFFEAPWTYLVNESSTFTPILVWFSAAEENMFDDRLIPTLVNIMVDRPSIHIVNLNETQVTSAGLIQLLELIAAAEDTDRDKPVTIECTAINEQVIGRFKELQSSRIELQLPEGELLTTEKESLIDY